MQEVLVSKIFNYTSTPTKNVEGQFWFNPSTNVLSRFNGTVWKPITVSSDDVAVLTDGSTVSLTSYLNTQIAALAEGFDSKQDKLKFYSEVDKSNDPSIDSTGSEINLKTSASQYGGSSINLTASTGQYKSGNINLKAKSFDTSNGGDITLETEGGNVSGGNITLHSKFNSSSSAEISQPGGKISLIADGSSDANGKSNILLSANNIQLDGNLKGTTVNTSIPADPDDNHILTSKAVKTELDKKQNNLQYYSETSEGIYSATISVGNINLRGSVAEGSNTTTSNNQCHAEGYGTTASGDSSHAEGKQTTASGQGSHAEGYSTTASGLYSHAEGSGTEASGNYSHSEGYNTKASANFQHVLGFYNIEDTNITPYIPETSNPVDTKGIYATIIGNGTSTSARSNAATVSWDGISWSQTDVRSGGTDQDSAAHSLSAKQNATDNNLTTTDKTIVGAINELKTDKQNTLKYYSESDSSTEPSSNNAQVSILGSSDYQTTLNLGFESSNGIQTVNIGGSSNDRRINIGTKICGNYNNVTIGNASDGVLLTLNTGRGLAGTGVTKDLSTSATDAQFPTAAAVKAVTDSKQNATDNTLTTTAKTISGAINELKTATDSMVVVSTDNAINVAPTTAQTGILIASSKTNGGNVIITPKITNTGACYLSTSSTYSNLNPIYPDPTNNKYTYPNLGTVYLFVDNAGDSADIVIENFAG